MTQITNWQQFIFFCCVPSFTTDTDNSPLPIVGHVKSLANLTQVFKC